MSEIIIPSSPEDRKKIKAAIKQISDSMTRIKGERDHIKTIKENIKDEFDLSPKYIQKVAAAFHKQNFEQEQQNSSDFEDLYEIIMASNSQTTDTSSDE